jgi:signal transduction histidine kinase
MTADNVEQYRDAIMKSLEDVERLSNTIRALLHLAQAESGQLQLHPLELDLAGLIDTISDHFLILAEAKAVRLSAQGPAPCPIEADRVMIERLVSNLVSNAIKYTPAGGEISLKWSAEGGRIELEVADTGCGIPPAALPHIFDRFYRVPGQDPEKGLGLGLSFAAWIVKAHNGTIDVESQVGAGTRFRIHLNRHFGVTKDSFGSSDLSS